MQRDHPNTVKTEDKFIGYDGANRYKFLKYIGRGSYGIVCSAVDTYTNEKVAIKKISGVFRNVSRAVKVLREIKLLRLLQHPNIVEIKSIIVPPSSDDFNDIFVVLEHMDSDLHKVIASIDSLTAEHHRCFMYQILHAVKFMHAANVYHLDLKPGNVLANDNGLIKVCDFGLSRVAFSEPSTVWRYTGYVGTRSYRAPEICGSEHSKYPYAVDIWSIGCIFAEIMTRKPLFPWKSLAHQLNSITNLLGTPSEDTISGIRNNIVRKCLRDIQKKTPVPFSERFPNSSPLALQLLQKLLAFDPKNRPTAEEALADNYFRGLPEPQSRPSHRISMDEFAFESCSMSDMEVRRLMYQEILEHQPRLLRNDLPLVVCSAPVYYHPVYGYYLAYGGTSWPVNPPTIEDISLSGLVTAEAYNAISRNVLSTPRPSLYEPTGRLQPLHPPYACSSRNVIRESVQNQVPPGPVFASTASRPNMEVNQVNAVTEYNREAILIHLSSSSSKPYDSKGDKQYVNQVKSVKEDGNRGSPFLRQLEELNIKPFIRGEEEQYSVLGLPYVNSSRNVTRVSDQNQDPPHPVSASTSSRPNMELNQVNAVTEGNTEELLRQLPNLSGKPHDSKEDKEYRETQ